ncbi:glycoside hydrolase family 3 protein [Trichoderma sp. SZMC 28013]
MRISLLTAFVELSLLPTVYSLFPNNEIPFPDCSQPPLSQNGICDTSLSTEARAAALVAELTLDEKAANLVNNAPGVERLGLPPYEWWNEALHGLAGVSPGQGINSTFTQGNVAFNSSTQFPSPIVLGAAFDDQLVHDIATAVSTEARAFSNHLKAGLDYWAPNINPYRDPRWGRGQETPGEDPYHVAQYAYNYVVGLQGGVGPAKPKVVSTCKHFAGYDIEDSNGVIRGSYNAIISTQDLAEYYLPSFRSCFRDAKAGAVMCSYNAVNGHPSCANSYMLETVLRDHWGWESSAHWVTGDCGAVDGVFSQHHVGQSAAQGVAFALNNGTDLDCGTAYSSNIASAVQSNYTTETQLDQALSRLYGSLIVLGYFDPPEGQDYRTLGASDVNTPATQKLAYTALVEGITLLKNDDNILPIRPTGQTVLFVGPWANNASVSMFGNYNGVAPYKTIPVPTANSSSYNWKVTYSQGLQYVLSNDTSQFAAAVSAAQEADVVVYIGGIDEQVEAEAHDRTSIDWPGAQLDLIQQLAAVKPVVVVQVGGGQVDDSSLLQNSNVKGLLWMGYPGQEFGPGLIDILSGVAAPAGRLPVTQYPADYINQVPMTDQSLRPSSSNPGRTYRWYNGSVIPFGTGLHYTEFNVSWATGGSGKGTYDTADFADVEDPKDLAKFDTFQIDVENIGSTASDYVALLFLKSTDSGPQPYPLKTLVAYARAHNVQPGATTTLDLKVNVGQIARNDANGNLVLYPGTYTLQVDTEDFGGPTAEFQVQGAEAVLDQFPQP